MRKCNKSELKHIYLQLESDDWGLVSAKLGGKNFYLRVKISPEGEFILPGFMAVSDCKDTWWRTNEKPFHLNIDDFTDLDLFVKGPMISDILSGLQHNAKIKEKYLRFVLENS